jgi:class 3 adenylate cyclase
MDIALRKFRKRGRRVIRLTATWIVVAALAAYLEYLALAAHGVQVPFGPLLGRYGWHAMLGGLSIGGAYIFLLHDPLRSWPLWRVLLLATALTAAMVALPVWFVNGDASAWHWRTAAGRFLAWALLINCTIGVLRLYDRAGGPGPDPLLDRWRKPRQELRIFMFLDMRSSTMIAEELGHARYFQLINELFQDITDPIVHSRGEIYQYVGDEISVSWTLRKGIKKQRCIRCFLDIRTKLRKRGPYYRDRYGIRPTFKAGFHYGEVTTGEVGLVKKERIFSGDVVNTTSHIQAMCNPLGVDILVSKDLLDVLLLSPAKYPVLPMGSIPLKGKRKAVELFTVARPGQSGDQAGTTDRGRHGQLGHRIDLQHPLGPFHPQRHSLSDGEAFTRVGHTPQQVARDQQVLPHVLAHRQHPAGGIHHVAAQIDGPL